jgi:hypothetical protein
MTKAERRERLTKAAVIFCKAQGYNPEQPLAVGGDYTHTDRARAELNRILLSIEALHSAGLLPGAEQDDLR